MGKHQSYLGKGLCVYRRTRNLLKVFLICNCRRKNSDGMYLPSFFSFLGERIMYLFDFRDGFLLASYILGPKKYRSRSPTRPVVRDDLSCTGLVTLLQRVQILVNPLDFGKDNTFPTCLICTFLTGRSITCTGEEYC